MSDHNTLQHLLQYEQLHDEQLSIHHSLLSLSYMSNTHSIQDIKDFLLILICRFFHRTTHYRLLFLLLLLLQLSSFLLFLLLTLTFLLLEILVLLNSNISLHTYLSLIYTPTKLATKAGSGRTSI